MRAEFAAYHAALDVGSDPAVIGSWITETQARKLAAQARQRASRSPSHAQLHGRTSKQEITARNRANMYEGSCPRSTYS
jgi:hypothetical protein